MATEVTLRPGETFTFPLQGRGSAGYSWFYEVSGSQGAVEVRIEGVGEPPPATAERPTSGSRGQQLFVKALSLGEGTIHLLLRRSWERDRPALAEHVLHVVVRS